jgi:hypothetical protein
MGIFGIGDEVVGLARDVVKRVWPDADAADLRNFEVAMADRMAQKEIELAQMAAQKDMSLAQTAINAEEAKSSNLFVSGWRPFIGWVCGVCIALYYIPMFIIGMTLWVWASVKAGVIVPRPELGIMDILGLAGSMLGLSLIRMTEKIKGVAR